MKILTKQFWKRFSKQAAAIAPVAPLVASTPTPAPATSTPSPAPIAKTTPTSSPMTTTLPTIAKAPAAVAPKTAPAATFDPLNQSKVLTREMFETMPHPERSKFFQNGGTLASDVHRGDIKGAAEETISRMKGDPDTVAEVLLRGFALLMADATPLMIAWGESHHDASFKFYTEAQCKEALSKAEKSPKPLGYLKPKAAKTGFKAPGEVPEPERVAAEDALVKLLKDFESNTNPVLKRIWWERHHEEVEETAKNETKRGHNWIAYFVTQLPFPANAHIVPSK
jgi:hypothetical protein